MGPPEAYQTYRIATPRDTAVRAACSQVGCLEWRHGWTTTVDETTGLGRGQADYIRRRSGRTFREQRTAAGLTVFRFESGQRCFREHSTRPEIFWVQGGDWRANPLREFRKYDKPEHWVYDFAEHQDKINTQRERG